MSAGDTVRTGLRGLGQLLITVGLVVLLFCVYELEVTNLVTARAQDRLSDELQRSWSKGPGQTVPDPAVPGPAVPDPAVPGQTVPGRAAPGPAAPGRTVPAAAPPVQPVEGDALARLYVPGLDGYGSRTVVEGTSVGDLKDGPGHIVGTALPGGVGNVVLSGHRTTYGAPFSRWDELDPGELVVLETRDEWFTYTVTGSRVVAPTAIEVTYAVPGEPGATPTRRLLTMTTCNPKYSARQRLIVSAELSATSSKADGLPAALEGA